MQGVVGSLIPVFALIMLGWFLRRASFPHADFWPPLERLTYFVLFPGLLFNALAGADLSATPVLAVGIVLAAMMTMMAAMLIAAQLSFRMDGPAFTSLFQGAVRWNSFVALAAISALFGRDGLTLAAVAIAVMVPLANIFSVLALVWYGKGGPASWASIAEQIARNPLIQACAAGILVQLLHIPVPGPVLTAAKMLGDASLVLGLFAVGASLNLAVARVEALNLTTATLLKLVATPLLAASLCWAMGLEGLARGCVLICSAVPGAASSYILAKQLGGDAELMSGITTVQTLAAMATMPLVLWLLL
jgi:malonate transporter and related proteins